RAAQCRGDARDDRGAEPHPARADYSHPAAARAVAGRAALCLSRIIVLTPGTGLVPAIRVFGQPSTAAKTWVPGSSPGTGSSIKDLATSIGGGEFVGEGFVAIRCMAALQLPGFALESAANGFELVSQFKAGDAARQAEAALRLDPQGLRQQRRPLLGHGQAPARQKREDR